MLTKTLLNIGSSLKNWSHDRTCGWIRLLSRVNSFCRKFHINTPYIRTFECMKYHYKSDYITFTTERQRATVLNCTTFFMLKRIQVSIYKYSLKHIEQLAIALCIGIEDPVS